MEADNLNKMQKVVLENRKKLIFTGIKEVDEFDSNQIILRSSLGNILVKGEELKVIELNLEKGEIEIKGLVNSITYSKEKDLKKSGSSLVKRMFK